MVKITPSFEIEVETIDNDHRRLVDFTNQITAAIDDQQYAECARLVPDFIALSNGILPARKRSWTSLIIPASTSTASTTPAWTTRWKPC